MANFADYSTLIEKFREQDSDCDGRVTFSQYESLLKDMGMSTSKEYCQVSYSGLVEPGERGVTFSQIRTLYEVQLLNKTKIHMIILFKGVDDDLDCLVNEEEFRKLAKVKLNNYDDKSISNLFNQCCPNSQGLASYHEVANHIFGIKVKPTENPYKEKIQILSPHSACCNLI